MTTEHLTNNKQFESSLEYLNQFKKIIVPSINGVDPFESDPIRIELNKIILSKYKIFDDYEKSGKTFEFCINGSLITVVGPNCSGKTALLEAVQFFCTAVKEGSGCYSTEEAQQLYGTAQESRVLLEGNFKIYYQNTNDTKDLKLQVLLVPGQFKCDQNATCAKNSRKLNRFVHVYITMPFKTPEFYQQNDYSQYCPKCSNNLWIRKSDQGIFEHLFPNVVMLNKKNGLNNYLRDLSDEISEKIIQNQQEINDEITRIFPFVRISSTRGTVSADTSGSNKKTTVILMDRNKRVYQFGNPESKLEDAAPLSDGLVQCLLIIITVCCTPPNSIIIIDEPDAHVFPIAQKKLIKFFDRQIESRRQSNSFLKLLITTHSPDIMESVKLEDIRQIFIDPKSHLPIVIKPLDSIDQLYNALMDIGASFVTHSELVHLGVHRKLLYLEGTGDVDFFNGIINKMAPDLLAFPYTRITNGGRAQSDKIEVIIRELRKLLPKNSVLHVFILVDADLYLKDVLEKQKGAYEKIEEKFQPNVKIYYHCWAVREWENWLLYNENLLFQILCDNQLCIDNQSIQQLRVKIKQHRQSEIIFHTQNTTTSNSVDKSLFHSWFAEELERCFGILVPDLIAPQMTGEGIREKCINDLAHKAYEKYVMDNNITVDWTQFGKPLEDLIKVFIGKQIQRQANRPLRNNPRTAANKLQELQHQWFTERNLKQQHSDFLRQQPIDLHDSAVRAELTKWIDAKLFFHQLIHGQNDFSKHRDLDPLWIEAFSQTAPGKCDLYSRFFNSLDSQQYPDDFGKLLEELNEFITAK